MEEFEVKALSTCPYPSSLWLRFLDDTFVINKAEHSQALLQYINNQDPHIQFTVEPTQQGSLPFLDTLVTIEPNNTFSTTVYRKPTHTDQYLHWDSNHHITAKQTVYKYISSHGQGGFFLTRQTGQRFATHQISTTNMPVPQLSTKPVAP